MEKIGKIIAGVGVVAASFLPMKESVAQTNYSQLDKKYHLEQVDAHGQELKDKVLIPEKEQEAVKSFLRVADEYGSNVNETDFLKKINQYISQFSNFHVEVSKPLGPKDPIKDNVLLLKGMVEMEKFGAKGVKKIEKVPFTFSLVKNNGKWAIQSLSHNYVENYRNFFSPMGYFSPDGKNVLVSGTGGDIPYIYMVIKGSKGEWDK